MQRRWCVIQTGKFLLFFAVGAIVCVQRIAYEILGFIYSGDQKKKKNSSRILRRWNFKGVIQEDLIYQ